jgi:hypothetical protein
MGLMDEVIDEISKGKGGESAGGQAGSESDKTDQKDKTQGADDKKTKAKGAFGYSEEFEKAYPRKSGA